MGKNNVDLFGHDRGLGDTISRAINKISRGRIKECGGCTKRKEALNRIIPYRDVEKRK
jgi:hypothetical protein